MIHPDIRSYNTRLFSPEKEICETLMEYIYNSLSTSTCKLRHAHPVWFLDGNPIVGYSTQKKGICLMFRSGQSFDEEKLIPSGSFKASQTFYTSVDQINTDDLIRRLSKSQTIQRDYKNIVKRKGKLEKIT